jgi:S1-C subfamily serine protease
VKAALVAVFLSGCALFQYPEATKVRPVDAMIGRTVLLTAPGCTGVRVGSGKVVTAKHCIEGMKLGGRYSGMTIEYIDAKLDYAVLAGDTAIPPVAIRNVLPGERVFVVGYPGSLDDDEQHLTVTDGVFTGVTSDGLERITAYAYYGNSGGGVWTEDAELAGILVEMRPAVDGAYGVVPYPAHSYMVPISAVVEAL